MNRLPRAPIVLLALICVIALTSPVLAQPTTQPLPPPPTSLEHVTATWVQRGQSLLGLIVFIAIAFALGRLRGAQGPVPWRVVIWGVVLQFAFGVIVLNFPGLMAAVQYAVQALLDYTKDGARFVFGNLIDNAVPVTPGEFDAAGTKPIGYAQTGAVFAFFVCPTIIFFSALTAIAYHSGILQLVVKALAWVMHKTTGTSGAETLSTAANIFVGQTEAPLIIRPFVAAATNSELMVIMVGGFANIASGVLGLYTLWLSPFIDEVAGHLAAACFISAPAALVVGKLLLPETTTPQTSGGVDFKVERVDANLVDAAARGTFEGLTLALNVAAMLIAFTALVALVNGILGAAFGYNPLADVVNRHYGTGLPRIPMPTLEEILAYVMAPLAWLCGIPWGQCDDVGSLLGLKTVLNELIAYAQMRDRFVADRNFLDPRSAIIATYALCGFANFASIGIQIGGISTLAPARRSDLSRLALVAMIGGAIASFMTACVVGVLL
jgi:concentrative nucleoside transporter, CNT family